MFKKVVQHIKTSKKKNYTVLTIIAVMSIYGKSFEKTKVRKREQQKYIIHQRTTIYIQLLR